MTTGCANAAYIKKLDNKAFGLELQEAAILSDEDTFIGYSGNANPPYKEDFIKQMDTTLTAMKRDGEFAKIINR